MLGFLYLDIICSSRFTVILELRSRKALASPGLSVNGDDRRKTREGDDWGTGEKRVSFFSTRPRSSPARFSIVRNDREPVTGW